MEKHFISLISVLLIGINIFSQSNKNTVSLSMGYGLEFESSIYIDFDDPDFTIWATPILNLNFSAGYEYSLSDYLKVGTQLEYEKINFDSYYTDETYANRLALGFQFLCTYPKSALHAELGGYLNLGRITCEEFDNPINGFDNGLIFGPGFQYDNINIALHFKPCFGYYFITDGSSPESGLIMYPKIFSKISYSF